MAAIITDYPATTYPATAAVAAEPLIGAFSLRDVLVQWFYNARIILVCLGIGLALGIIGALLSPPQYTASSLLLIRTDTADAVQRELAPAIPANDADRRIVQSNAQILQSDTVVRRAVERMGPAFLARGWTHLFRPRPIGDAVERFKHALHVATDPESDVIHVSFSNGRREVSLKALQALIDAFGQERAGVYTDAAAGLQGQELRDYASELDRLDSRIREVSARHDVLDIAQDIQLANNRLDSVAQRTSQARERLSEVRGELRATASGLAATPGKVFESSEATNATANDDARNTLLRLRQDRAHMAAEYNSKWPGLKELDQKIAQAQAQIAQNGQARYVSNRDVRNPVVDQLDGRLASLKIERRSLRDELAELARQSGQAQARINDLRDADTQLHKLQRSRDVAENVYRQLAVAQAGTMLNNQAVAGRDNGFRVVQPPSAPPKGRSLALTYLAAGLLVGLAAGLVASGLATLLRQVFITPGEASRALRLPSLADFDVPASNFNSPEGAAAMSRFATFLVDADADGRRLQVMQILATELDGKSLFALELGRTLAQEHDQRTLIIDLDAEGYYQKCAVKSSEFRDLSTGKATVRIARAANPKLWLTLDGRNSPFGDPALALSDVRDSLEAVKPHFDRILIVAQKDFGPYAARRLHALADANVLLVRSERTRLPAAQQLKETVLAAGGDILGFVFTFRRFYIPKVVYQWL